MKRVVSADEMRRYEQERFSDGRASSLDWMERASQGVNALLDAHYPNQSALVVCGGGNNGGDGFALLRMLHARGIDCAGVLLADVPSLKGDAKTNYLRALESNVHFFDVLSDDLLAQYDVLVDAVFGAGLSRPVSGVFADAIERMNTSGKPIVAVDIPSGVDATSGAVLGVAIRANETVTFEYDKRGLLLFPGRGYCGEVVVHPLSYDPPQDGDVLLFTREDAARLLPRRAQDAHKGTSGRVLLCVGSKQYIGAALLCTGAALRVGAGLTTAAVPGAEKAAFSTLPEAMAAAVNDGADWDEAACEQAIRLLPQKTAVGIGCGVGAGNIMPLVEAVLNSRLPVVLDADALNQLSRAPKFFDKLHESVVLTPHPVEMARLCGESVEAILADPIETARKYANKWGCVVLLKGATTCISDGRETRLNITGNAGLAKGGSGDVLAGLITGLLAQGLPAIDAASVGAFLLGSSAETAFTLLQERMMLARDVIGAVEQTIQGV